MRFLGAKLAKIVHAAATSSVITEAVAVPVVSWFTVYLLTGSHSVATPYHPRRSSPSFSCFTPDLAVLAETLRASGVSSDAVAVSC